MGLFAHTSLRLFHHQLNGKPGTGERKQGNVLVVF